MSFAFLKMGTDEDKSDLNYIVWDHEYPLHSNAAILNIGSAGSGKTYFCYHVLLPVYITHFGIKSVLICSRTGHFDHTAAHALKNPIYDGVSIEYIKVEDSFRRCQEIRAQAIINDFLSKCMKVKSDKQFAKMRDAFKKLVNNDSKLEYLVSELKRFDQEVITKFMFLSIDEMHDFAELMLCTGTRYIKDPYIPILIVYDDYSGEDAFIKPYSDIHKLIYCRRHLHLTMIMNVQSLVSISQNIKRNATIFVCFSTLSEKDIEMLSERVPYSSGFNKKSLKAAFIQINDADDRNDKLLTLFTVYPNQRVVLGSPTCVRRFLVQPK